MRERGRQLRPALVFLFSLANLALLAVTATAFDSRGEWSLVQFAGLYGVVEAATGLANLVAANFWALPVIRFNTPNTTIAVVPISTLRKVHAEGLGRVAAGGAFVAYAAIHYGFEPLCLLVVPFILVLGGGIVGLSGLVARFGVARPDLDVLKIALTWRRREHELPPFSLSTSLLQVTLTLIALPLAGLLPVTVLFRPHLEPSLGAWAVVVGLALAATTLFLVTWRGKIAWHAAPVAADDVQGTSPADSPGSA